MITLKNEYYFQARYKLHTSSFYTCKKYSFRPKSPSVKVIFMFLQ